jgi:hypothetical protein
MRCAAVVAMLTCGVAACSAEHDALERAEAVGAQVAEARCACTELAQNTATQETCIEAQKRRWEAEVLPIVRADHTKLRTDALDRCLALLRSCAVQSHEVPPCSRLFAGQLALGEPCLNRLQCESGVCERGGCFESSAGHCAEPLDGPGFCADDSFCVDGFTCQGGGCAPALREGEACSGVTPGATGCEPGLVCIPEEGTVWEFACRAQRAAGQRCGTEHEAGWSVGFAACEEGLLCSTSSFECEEPGPPAIDRRGLGERCVTSGPTEETCGSELVCSAGKCALPKRLEEPCTSAEECASHVCRGATCRDALEDFSCREP